MANLEKLVEELSGLTLLEAAELKTMLEEKLGVTAAVGGGMMMMAPARRALSLWLKRWKKRPSSP